MQQLSELDRWIFCVRVVQCSHTVHLSFEEIVRALVRVYFFLMHSGLISKARLCFYLMSSDFSWRSFMPFTVKNDVIQHTTHLLKCESFE